MSDIKWTDAQSLAIDSRGDVLVSAAAGSGKTAVLVQRVMKMIESECDIDELLIVTFTRAAAAQMREKIAAAIAEKLAQNQNDERMLRQQILLEKTLICTIDSFCADVLKNNFHSLGDIDISMNYSNLDSAQFSVLSREVIDEVLDEKYEAGGENFKNLMDAFTAGKSDRGIYDIISTLHFYTSAFVDREQWIEEKISYYLDSDAGNSYWGDILLEEIKENLSMAVDYIQRALKTIGEDVDTFTAYEEFFRADCEIYQNALDAVNDKAWDKLFFLKDIKFPTFPRKTKGIDTLLREKAKSYRDTAKGLYQSSLSRIVENEAQFKLDNSIIYPVAKELAEFYKDYEKRLFERKLELQSFEFSDIEHLALQILTDENRLPTAVALEYKNRFKGILVDEYQDTNGVQDLIFRTISDNNLFVVGDVKQSIYRFRQAMPKIFINRRDELEEYKRGDKSGYILLKNNFRSDKSVTDFVNFLFGHIMSRELGDVDYNEDEYLIPSEKNEDKFAFPAQVHILENVYGDEEKINSKYYEGRYIASLIKNRIESGETAFLEKDEDGEAIQRKLEYNDFCILVRSSLHLAELEQAFRDEGVPFNSFKGENLFDTNEIMLVMSFLRAIDNPLRDIDLLAVMYSEIFGFSADELALIRIAKPKGSIYSAVKNSAELGDKKCAEFIEKIENYRTLASTMEPSEFLRRFYQDSSLSEILCAQAGGRVKQANLLKFANVCRLYSDAGYYGLTGLVRFLEKVKQNNPDISEAYLPERDNTVKIMTVHASKGLEFPIVIYAFTNNSNAHSSHGIILNRDAGIGMNAKEAGNSVTYYTTASAAVALANKNEDTSEEMRVHYVALTRAKSQIIIVGTYDGKPDKNGCLPRERKLASLINSTADKEVITPVMLKNDNNFLSWIVMCLSKHPECTEELSVYAPETDFVTANKFAGAFLLELPDYKPAEISESEEKEFSAPVSKEKENEILSNFAFKYPYEAAGKIQSKQTPSALAEQDFSLDYAFSPPDFMLEESFNAAQRGTATHRFMEKVRDFKKFDFNSECNYMLKAGFLDESQLKVLDKGAIKAFFESELAKRMASAEKLVREYEISYLEDASFFNPELGDEVKGEQVFVDGMLDAAFIENGKGIIVDYKTDRVKTAEELKEKYSKQLLLYKRALEQIWGIEIAECHIYSFALKKDILTILN